MNERTLTRTETTYMTHSGEEKPQTVIVTHVHSDLADEGYHTTANNIRVEYTIREHGNQYMAFAEASRPAGKYAELSFKGNVLWKHNSMPLKKLEDLIDGIGSLEELKRNFAA